MKEHLIKLQIERDKADRRWRIFEFAFVATIGIVVFFVAWIVRGSL